MLRALPTSCSPRAARRLALCSTRQWRSLPGSGLHSDTLPCVGRAALLPVSLPTLALAVGCDGRCGGGGGGGGAVAVGGGGGGGAVGRRGGGGGAVAAGHLQRGSGRQRQRAALRPKVAGSKSVVCVCVTCMRVCAPVLLPRQCLCLCSAVVRPVRPPLRSRCAAEARVPSRSVVGSWHGVPPGRPTRQAPRSPRRHVGW